MGNRSGHLTGAVVDVVHLAPDPQRYRAPHPGPDGLVHALRVRNDRHSSPLHPVLDEGFQHERAIPRGAGEGIIAPGHQDKRLLLRALYHSDGLLRGNARKPERTPQPPPHIPQRRSLPLRVGRRVLCHHHDTAPQLPHPRFRLGIEQGYREHPLLSLDTPGPVHQLLHRSRPGAGIGDQHGDLLQNHNRLDLTPKELEHEPDGPLSGFHLIDMSAGLVPDDRIRMLHHLGAEIGMEVEGDHDRNLPAHLISHRGQQIPLDIIQILAGR